MNKTPYILPRKAFYRNHGNLEIEFPNNQQIFNKTADHPKNEFTEQRVFGGFGMFERIKLYMEIGTLAF